MVGKKNLLWQKRVVQPPQKCRQLTLGLESVGQMPGQSRWFAIKDECCDGERIREKLSNYPNLIFHRNPRSVYLSERNFEPSDWKKLVNALK